MLPVSIVDRIAFLTRDILDICDTWVELRAVVGLRGRGGMNEFRCVRELADELEPLGTSWRSADCTEMRLSWRRYAGWSANPLKLTTLVGLGVDGTDALGVLNGSRPPSSPPSLDWGSLGRKNPEEGRGGSSEPEPEVDGREDDDAEDADELDGLGSAIPGEEDGEGYRIEDGHITFSLA